MCPSDPKGFFGGSATLLVVGDMNTFLVVGKLGQLDEGELNIFQ